MRDRRLRPRKALWGREWKRRVGVRWVGSRGGISFSGREVAGSRRVGDQFTLKRRACNVLYLTCNSVRRASGVVVVFRFLPYFQCYSYERDNRKLRVRHKATGIATSQLIA